jgi:hypothetical protein
MSKTAAAAAASAPIPRFCTNLVARCVAKAGFENSDDDALRAAGTRALGVAATTTGRAERAIEAENNKTWRIIAISACVGPKGRVYRDSVCTGERRDYLINDAIEDIFAP